MIQMKFTHQMQGTTDDDLAVWRDELSNQVYDERCFSFERIALLDTLYWRASWSREAITAFSDPL